jgi:hypothetical protein
MSAERTLNEATTNYLIALHTGDEAEQEAVLLDAAERIIDDQYSRKSETPHVVKKKLERALKGEKEKHLSFRVNKGKDEFTFDPETKTWIVLCEWPARRWRAHSQNGN